MGFFLKLRMILVAFVMKKQYGDAVEQLLIKNNIRYEKEKRLPISFEGEQSGRNIADFLIEGKILLELKTKRMVNREDYYQVRRYLESLNLKLGILANFRDRYLKPHRILNSNAKHSQFVD